MRMNRSSFQMMFAAAGVLLLAASLTAQQQGQAQQGGGQGQGAAQGGGRQGGGGAGAGGGGRQGGAPAGFQNLTVLPRDIPQPQLIAVMRAFESALGVTCEHCHVFFGAGNPMNNMASDDKAPKKTARVMMLAVRDFNAKLIADVGKPVAQLTQAQCGTCHRGSAIPKYEAPPAPPAPAGGGGGGRQGGGGGGGGRQGGGGQQQ
jgi:hypothetical protein